MRGKFLCGIGLFASLAAGAGSAVAADMPVRPPPVAASPACCAVPDWTGFYVGIHGGGGWGHTSFEPSESLTLLGLITVPTVPPGPSVSSSGGVFGFQFGHNWQWGPVVGGLEIDFSGADIKGSNTFSSPIVPIVPLGATVTRDVKIDELASARGRLGYLIFPNWLLYGTAGIGWGHTRITNTSSLTVALDELLPTLFTARQTNFFNEFGWVAGAGLEWKFADHWLLRGEWLHYDFARDSHNQTLLGTTILFDGGNPRTTVDVARAALSYKF